MSQKDDVFIKVFIGVLLGLVVFTIAIIILANSVGVLEQESVSGSYGGQSTLEQRIQPVGQVRIAGEAPAQAVSQPAAAAAPADGQQVYVTACAACHDTGAAGAPKVGDAGAWGTRIAQGMDVLNQHAIQGFQGMPPKGGRLDLSDEAVVAAVAHMVENSD